MPWLVVRELQPLQPAERQRTAFRPRLSQLYITVTFSCTEYITVTLHGTECITVTFYCTDYIIVTLHGTEYITRKLNCKEYITVELFSTHYITVVFF